jgi:Protein of unknown function (DUF1364)
MKHPLRRRDRPDRSAEFASYEAPQVSARMATPHDLSVRIESPALDVKLPDKVRPDLRESARGEMCLVRLPGCQQDPAMTILSHNRHYRAGKGLGTKAHDMNTAYCCTWCDAIYDGAAGLIASCRPDVELAWYHAHAETLVRMAKKGLL